MWFRRKKCVRMYIRLQLVVRWNDISDFRFEQKKKSRLKINCPQQFWSNFWGAIQAFTFTKRCIFTFTANSITIIIQVIPFYKTF